jgi:hypothetical protein
LRRLLSLLTISSALLFVTAAHADTVTFHGVPTTGIPGATDTLTFGATTATVVGGVVSQAGSFLLVASLVPEQVYPFTFQENVTVGGITELLTFSAEDNVTDVQDTLTIFALGNVTFGTAVLDFQSSSVSGDNAVAFPVDITANVSGVIPAPIPEPSTLALSATGLMAFVGATRRKFLRA